VGLAVGFACTSITDARRYGERITSTAFAAAGIGGSRVALKNGGTTSIRRSIRKVDVERLRKQLDFLEESFEEETERGE
jgi:hypothetical protein